MIKIIINIEETIDDTKKHFLLVGSMIDAHNANLDEKHTLTFDNFFGFRDTDWGFGRSVIATKDESFVVEILAKEIDILKEEGVFATDMCGTLKFNCFIESDSEMEVIENFKKEMIDNIIGIREQIMFYIVQKNIDRCDFNLFKKACVNLNKSKKLELIRILRNS